MNYILRSMTKEDFSIAGEIMVLAFKKEPWRETWTIKQCKKRFAEIFSSSMNFSFVLQNEQEEILGCCLGLLSTYMDHQEYTIIDFFVHPECQHRHIGSQLMSQVIQVLKEHHVKKVTLNTIKACTPFYEKCGFTPTKEGIILEKIL